MAKGGYRGGMPMGMGGKSQMQMMKQAQKMLQDMVVAAVNEAMRKAEADQTASMSKLTGGLNLGGLF